MPRNRKPRGQPPPPPAPPETPAAAAAQPPRAVRPPSTPGPSEPLPFKEAQAFARTLRLTARAEWEAWCKGGKRPPNVPPDPQAAYADAGWVGWRHWLGTAAQHARQCMRFGEALAVARGLGLSSTCEWKVWCKSGARPMSVPSDPATVYKERGWQGWGHWLGRGDTGAAAPQYPPFKEALAFARSLGLAGLEEWRAWCMSGVRRINVHPHPNVAYKASGWRGWAHWLGGAGGVGKAIGAGSGQSAGFLSFTVALAAARALGLKSGRAWATWCRGGARPARMPADPAAVYRHDGWQSMAHWLGTAAHAKNKKNAAPAAQFLPFEEALARARTKGFASSADYYAWCKSGARPPDMPGHPPWTYRSSGWQGWGHFLGTGNQHQKKFLPFADALKLARSLNFTSNNDWVRKKER